MKKSVLLVALLGILMGTTQAQDHNHARCFTNEITDPLIANDPQYQKNREDLEKFTEDFVKNQSHQRRASNQVYIIPVVFHILHNYGPENVPDQVIHDAMASINTDFRKLNADTSDIIQAFQSIAADAEIEFRLATIDPNGNCTNGIEHIWTLETYTANDSSKMNPNWLVWPTSKYLNIWVANSLQNSGAAAYAHLPGGPNNTDGIMCQYTYVSNYNRTLTHEIGHHLNLLHVWGNTNTPGIDCTRSDGVGDTPTTKGWDTCPTEANADVCTTGVVENYQNFMEYSFCDVMFTEGQKLRMHACLNASASQRNNLWTQANLVATGTDQPGLPDCAPVADFKSEAFATCVGAPISFYDQSWNGTVTSYNWQFPGGTPSTSTDPNPQVVYNTAGIYDVTLVVSNAIGSDSMTKTSTIHVSGSAMQALPYVENFEDSSSFPGIDGWTANNDGGSIHWQRVNFASSDSGQYSIKINNYTNVVRNIEDWITPSMSFTGITWPIKLEFDVAHAQRSLTAEDQLTVYYSNDCGLNWNPVWGPTASPALATNGGNYVTSSFTPSASQWRRESVNLNSIQNFPNIRFKFENTTARGNNIYIDNINVYGNGVGIEDSDNLESGFSMYPNPSNGVTNVEFNLLKSSTMSLEVKDIIGQSVSKVFTDKRYEAGLHKLQLPELTPGVYLINLTVNNKTLVGKLLVN